MISAPPAVPRLRRGMHRGNPYTFRLGKRRPAGRPRPSMHHQSHRSANLDSLQGCRRRSDRMAQVLRLLSIGQRNPRSPRSLPPYPSRTRTHHLLRAHHKHLLQNISHPSALHRAAPRSRLLVAPPSRGQFNLQFNLHARLPDSHRPHRPPTSQHDVLWRGHPRPRHHLHGIRGHRQPRGAPRLLNCHGNPNR